MLFTSNVVRTVVLWWVGRLLMLDCRISRWQHKREGSLFDDHEDTLPGKTLRIPKDDGMCNAKGGAC